MEKGVWSVGGVECRERREASNTTTVRKGKGKRRW